MYKKELVSVIIPIYNAELSIDNCVYSIIRQSYRNLEIILVNDGSSDNSLDLCYQISQIDNRIIVLNKINEGVSSARNEGLSISKGKYCCFVDSDDWIEQNHIESMVQEISEVDCIICGYKRIIHDKVNIRQLDTKLYSMNNLNEKSLIPVFKEGFVHPCWNKLFKMDIIRHNNISFNTSLHISEDSLFCITYLRFCHSFKVIASATYYYEIFLQSSLSKKMYSNILEIYELIFNELRQLLIIGHCNDNLIKHITIETIYPQLYSIIFKIYASENNSWKDKRKKLYDLSCSSFFYYIMNSEYKYIKNKVEKFIVCLILHKQFLILGGLMKWINK